DTTTSGPHEVSVIAVDAAGNTSHVWVTYIVADPAVNVQDANVVEGPGATLDFLVTLTNPSNNIITINYATADGTAVAPVDYTETARALTFQPGDPLTQTISVPVVDDATWRGTRNLTLSLVTATDAAVGNGTATGAIVDDDPPPVSVPDASVKEGAGA